MNTKNLTLYHFDSCPFCRRVRDYLSANGIEVQMKDTLLDPAARQELMSLGGKTQVPALRMENDKVLYESRDIMQWFQDNVLVGTKG
jgi:glutathione S-transferase